MSDIFVQQWVNSNEERNYPLDDTASGASDSGELLPSNIFADLVIALPAALISGGYVFVSTVAVSANIASFTLSAITGGGVIQAIAACSVTKPAIAARHHQLQALYPGVGGWVVFGVGVNYLTSSRLTFSTPGNARLLNRTTRPYSGFNIASIGVDNITPLTGLVNLQAGNGIDIISDVRTIDDVENVRCIVIRTSEDIDAVLLSDLSGPCGSRPEMDNCANKVINSVNGVVPNCDSGNLDVIITGEGFSAETTEGLITVASDVTLTDICPAEHLPTLSGCLPGDECADADLLLVSGVMTAELTAAPSKGGHELPGPSDAAPAALCPLFDAVNDGEYNSEACVWLGSYPEARSFDYRYPNNAWYPHDRRMVYRTYGHIAEPAYAINTCDTGGCVSKLIRCVGYVDTDSDTNSGLYIVFGYQHNNGYPTFNFAGINFAKAELGIYKKTPTRVTTLMNSSGVAGNGDTLNVSDLLKSSITPANSAGVPRVFELALLILPSDDDYYAYLFVDWRTIPVGQRDGYAIPNMQLSSFWLKKYLPSGGAFTDGHYGIGASASRDTTRVEFTQVCVSGINANAGYLPPNFSGEQVLADMYLPAKTPTDGLEYYFDSFQVNSSGSRPGLPVVTIWDNLA